MIINHSLQNMNNEHDYIKEPTNQYMWIPTMTQETETRNVLQASVMQMTANNGVALYPG